MAKTAQLTKLHPVGPVAHTGAAERMRRSRSGRRRGLTVLPVCVDEGQLIDALIAFGKLTERQAADRNEIARALERIIADWSAASGTLAKILLRVTR